jgi:drug/metabolite transporter (DMT)-like permease
MMSNEIAYIVIGVAVVALIVWLQLKTRPVRENSSTRLTLILGVIGIVEIYNAGQNHKVGVAPKAWIVASLIAAAVLGAIRALTVKIWRIKDGSALSKGTAVTVALWIVSLGAHFGLEFGIDHSTKIVGLGRQPRYFTLP